MTDPNKQLEDKYLKFLKARVTQKGKISLQNLSGHLSAVSSEIRNLFGTSLRNLKDFLTQHSDIFIIKNDIVTLVGPEAQEKIKIMADVKNELKDDVICGDSLPSQLRNVKGKIIKLFPMFGFISITEPCKTTVYFDAAKFEDGACQRVDQLNLTVGQAVCLNAFRMLKNKGADYKALKVWLPQTTSTVSSNIKPEYHLSLSSLDSFSDESEIYQVRGTIQNLFDKYGFISFKKDSKFSSVFFHMKNIAKCPVVGNGVNLSDFLNKGDNVTFNAVPSKKQNHEVPWEATKVWLPHSAFKEVHTLSSESEIYQSSSDESFEEAEMVTVKPNNINDVLKIDSEESNSGDDLYSEYSVQNVIGHIFPLQKNKAIIKFKHRNEEISATANLNVIYLNGEEAQNLMWDVDEGWDVNFNAERSVDGNDWTATLVWRGHKPFIEENVTLSTTNDSERFKLSGESLGNRPLAGDAEPAVHKNSEKNNKAVNDTLKQSPFKYFGEWADSPFPIKETSTFPHPGHEKENPDHTKSQKNKNLTEKTNESKKNSEYTKPEKKKNQTEMANKSKETPDYTKAEKNKNQTEKTNVSKKISKDNGQYETETLYSSKDSTTLTAEKHLPVQGSLSDKTNKYEKAEGVSMITKNNISDTSVSYKPIIDIHKDTLGIVKCVKDYNGIVQCSKSGQKLNFSWKVVYKGEKWACDISSSLIGVLKESDEVHMNYSEISIGIHKWKPVSLMWVGKKPNQVNEVTPTDFLARMAITNIDFSAYSKENIENKKVDVDEMSPSFQKTQSSQLKTENGLKHPTALETQIETNADSKKNNSSPYSKGSEINEANICNTNTKLETNSTASSKLLNYAVSSQMPMQAPGSALFRLPGCVPSNYSFLPQVDSSVYRYPSLMNNANFGREKFLPNFPNILPQMAPSSVITYNPIFAENSFPSHSLLSEDTTTEFTSSRFKQQSLPLTSKKHGKECLSKNINMKPQEEFLIGRDLQESRISRELKTNKSNEWMDDMDGCLASEASVTDCSKLLPHNSEVTVKDSQDGISPDGYENLPQSVVHAAKETLPLQSPNTSDKKELLSIAPSEKSSATEDSNISINDKLKSQHDDVENDEQVLSTKTNNGSSSKELLSNRRSEKRTTLNSDISSSIETQDKICQKVAENSLLYSTQSTSLEECSPKVAQSIAKKPLSFHHSTLKPQESNHIPPMEPIPSYLVSNTEFGSSDTACAIPMEEKILSKDELQFSDVCESLKLVERQENALGDNTSFSDESMQKLCNMIVKRISELNIPFPYTQSTKPCCSHFCLVSPKMIDSSCQTDNDLQYLSSKPELETNISTQGLRFSQSKGTQTFITGKVICTDMYPS